MVHDGLKLGTGHLDAQMLGARLVDGDVGQVDVGLDRRGQLDLGLLGRLLEALQGHRVLAEVDALLLLELLHKVVHELRQSAGVGNGKTHLNVEVLASKVGVTVGGLDLKHTLLHLENRNIEGTASQIVNSNTSR